MRDEDIGPPKSGLLSLKSQLQTTNSSILISLFPEPLSKFPLLILFTFTLSNLLKLYVPFAIEDLYLNINANNFIYPSLKFIVIIVLNYYV